jgi:hypothetical protein
VSVLVPQQVELQQLRQYLYFCTSTASKLSTSSSRRILSRRREAGRYGSAAVPHPALASPYVSICQNPSTYVSICQHMSAYVSACCRGGGSSRTTRVRHTATPSGGLPRICMHISAPIRVRRIHVYACVYVPRRCMHIYAAPRSSVEHCVCVCIYRDGAGVRGGPLCLAALQAKRCIGHMRAQP